jgi:hypothetical protein
VRPKTATIEMGRLRPAAFGMLVWALPSCCSDSPQPTGFCEIRPGDRERRKPDSDRCDDDLPAAPLRRPVLDGLNEIVDRRDLNAADRVGPRAPLPSSRSGGCSSRTPLSSRRVALAIPHGFRDRVHLLKVASVSFR